jgi:hypothetical protein
MIMPYRIIRSKNLNAFKGEMETWEKKGYFPQWQSFAKDGDTYIIFMVKI